MRIGAVAASATTKYKNLSVREVAPAL